MTTKLLLLIKSGFMDQHCCLFCLQLIHLSGHPKHCLFLLWKSDVYRGGSTPNQCFCFRNWRNRFCGCSDPEKFFFYVMKINTFRGDLTDISAEQESLLQTCSEFGKQNHQCLLKSARCFSYFARRHNDFVSAAKSSNTNSMWILEVKSLSFGNGRRPTSWKRRWAPSWSAVGQWFFCRRNIG